MKIKWKKLILSLLIPLLVGGVSSLFTMNSMESFDSLKKPPLSPPGWLFPVVWTILYLLMGFASYIIANSQSGKERQNALFLYGLQLFVNFFWSIIFFNMEKYFLSFIWLVLLWVLILMTILAFRKISKLAGNLLIPYILWVTFAGYLNLYIYLLN